MSDCMKNCIGDCPEKAWTRAITKFSRGRGLVLIILIPLALGGCATSVNPPEERSLAALGSSESTDKIQSDKVNADTLNSDRLFIEKSKLERRSRSSGSELKLREYSEVTLSNGLRIFVVPDSTLPRIHLTALIKIGASSDPSELQGLNSFVARLLNQGTQQKNLEQFSNELGDMASELEIDGSEDFTTISGDCLSPHRDKFLELFSSAVMSPAFKDREIDRERKHILANIIKKTDDSDRMAMEKFEELVYGSHPYGRDGMGTQKTVKKILKKDIIKHYFNFYRPNNTLLTVVGQVDAEFLEKVRTQFGSWGLKAINLKTLASPTEVPGVAVEIVHKAGLSQTQLVFGHIGIPRSHPDYIKAQLLNEILGGGFVSRLNQKIRVEQGLTYSISSGFQTRLEKGLFVISTFTKNESVEKIIDETQKVFKEFVASGIQPEELESAKTQMLSHFPRLLETADHFAYNLIGLKFYGVPDNYLSDYQINLKAVTLEDANIVLKSLFHPENLKILVYTDKTKLGSQLKSYQKHSSL